MCVFPHRILILVVLGELFSSSSIIVGMKSFCMLIPPVPGFFPVDGHDSDTSKLDPNPPLGITLVKWI